MAELKPKARHWWQASLWLAPFTFLAIPLAMVPHPEWMRWLQAFLGGVGLCNFGYAAAVAAWREDYEAWLRMVEEAPGRIEQRVRQHMANGRR